jgi:hypothetical protein
MDPYLEQYWGDVHETMIIHSRAAIQKQLPPELVARVGERVFVEPSQDRPRNIVPDVRVVQSGHRAQPVAWSGNGVSLAEPLVIDLGQDEPVTQAYIEIIDLKSGRRVVTVIEILSPSNKVQGAGRVSYLKKQEELRAGNVSLVEIDLIRAGSRVSTVPFDRIPEGHRTPYAVYARRGWQPEKIEYYRVPLRERLPAIRIPLRQSDPDVALDLQAQLNQCYEEGRYDDIDYRDEPDPALEPDDARWADELLRLAGRR